MNTNFAKKISLALAILVAFSAFFVPVSIHAFDPLDLVDPLHIFHDHDHDRELVYYRTVVVDGDDNQDPPISMNTVEAYTPTWFDNYPDQTFNQHSNVPVYEPTWFGNEPYRGSNRTYNYNYNTRSGYYATPASLVVSCHPSPRAAGIGNRVLWSANVTGGTGFYDYYWSGTDNLVGTGNTISRFYNNAGTKAAQVTVFSGNQSKTQVCTSVIISEIDIPITNEPAPTYTQPQTGSTNTSSSKTQSTQSTQNKTTSSSNSVGYTGNVFSQPLFKPSVGNNQQGQASLQNLAVKCFPSVKEAYVGEGVIWTAEANRNSGIVAYQWVGSDALEGYNPAVVKIYTDAGEKSASVLVTSGDLAVAKACDVSVTIKNLKDNSGGNNLLAGIGGVITWPIFFIFGFLFLLMVIASYFIQKKSKIKKKEEEKK